jgi:hypothetical protein
MNIEHLNKHIQKLSQELLLKALHEDRQGVDAEEEAEFLEQLTSWKEVWLSLPKMKELYSRYFSIH